MVRLSGSHGKPIVRRAVVVLIAGVVLAAMAAARFGAGNPARVAASGATGTASITPSWSAATSAQSPQARFGISGSVTGLYPGASLPLVLSVTNPQQFTIVVTSITTTAGAPNATCAASNLTISSFTGSTPVPAGGTATITVAATMSHSSPDACQGAVFPLLYTGTAKKTS